MFPGRSDRRRPLSLRMYWWGRKRVGKGGKIRRRRRVLTQKKTTTIIDTRIRVHTNVSQSAEVKPTFYRRPLDSGMPKRRSSELELQRSCDPGQLCIPVGLAGRPFWVKGHCCLVPACQAVTAPSTIFRSQHAERQASDKSWSVGGRRSPWPLARAPQGPCERRALTLVAEALRTLSGLGLCSLVS